MFLAIRSLPSLVRPPAQVRRIVGTCPDSRSRRRPAKSNCHDDAPRQKCETRRCTFLEGGSYRTHRFVSVIRPQRGLGSGCRRTIDRSWQEETPIHLPICVDIEVERFSEVYAFATSPAATQPWIADHRIVPTVKAPKNITGVPEVDNPLYSRSLCSHSKFDASNNDQQRVAGQARTVIGWAESRCGSLLKSKPIGFPMEFSLACHVADESDHGGWSISPRYNRFFRSAE